MQRGLRSEIHRIGIIVVTLSVLGLAIGHLTLTLLLGFSAYLAWTFSQILKLYRWLESNREEAPPDAHGVWGDISDQLYRLQQGNKRAALLHRSIIARIKSITTALDEGLVLLNNHRELDWWNPAAEKVFNLERSDRNQPITNLVRAPAFVNFIQRGSFSKPLEIKAPNDDQRKLLISASTFDEGNIALVIQDITRLRNMEQIAEAFGISIAELMRDI